MDRGVLSVTGNQPRRGKRVLHVGIDEAYGREASRDTFPLKCSLQDPEFVKLGTQPPEVRQAGEKLYNALVAHQPLREFFAQTTTVMAPPAQPPVYPLYIRVEPPDAEELPWEILWEARKNFMVLDPEGRWPIGRLVSVQRRPAPLQRAIGTELRMAVVLAAARENGANEWASIAKAINELDLPVDVLALVSEEDAQKAIVANADEWLAEAPGRKVKVEFTGDSTALISRLRAHVPNVIHFFCHGVADVRPQLELETRADRRTRRDRGSITLDSKLLGQLARMDSLWLVVLNCCQGAKTAPHLHSLARDLVEAGVPAVVAMRQSVDVSDANLFAEHFYPRLFTQLQGILALAGNPATPKPILFQEIVWVRAVHEARRQLSLARGRAPDSSAEWTYPVVYIHRDDLALHPRELQAATLSDDQRLELLTQLEFLRAIRTALDYAPGADAAEQRTKLDAEIQQIEAQLAGE